MSQSRPDRGLPPGSYLPVSPGVDLPAMEREILAFWRQHDTFAKSLAASEGRPRWVFYEGPPTANGTPGVHHVEARVFKDVFPRYRTMAGYFVERKAGWDCHGLPVELAVEREIGSRSKQDIEAFGVARFNDLCRASVLRHVDEFEALTTRMGYWVDLSSAYWTMSPEYVDSLWWALKQIYEKGLLVEDHRVAPYCPRCGTGLSDHELAQGYETVVDPSVFVRFPLTGGELVERHGPVSLVVWTTTPWTLVSNTAVAVRADVPYAVARSASGSAPGELLVVAEPLVEAVLGSDAEIVETLPGSRLERMAYRRPFDLVEIDGGGFVVSAAFVTTDDGSGLVHLAPAFGADDLAAGRAHGLPVVNPIGKDGRFTDDVDLVGGMFFKDADKHLVEDLRERGLLLMSRDHEHSYPHCWRCHTPLMYYAQPSWYIRTTAIKDALLRENERTRWYPDNVKWGRYGDWLRNNIDWALSRDRYWGTPLPIWRCEQGHLTVVGSRTELGELAGRDLSELDPHRPYVDEVLLDCRECGSPATRVPQVADGWFDSGSMPFAQWGYPHLPGSVERFEESYPAQYICEGIDQTRGWFYTLMAVGTALMDRSSYETVLCLGLILAEDGRKMSKHLGNILEPLPVMEEHGADALRWFMAAGGSAWVARRVGHSVLQDVVRKTLLTYWNTASFQVLYAHASGYQPVTTPAPPLVERPALDRWALSEAHRMARGVGEALEDFDAQRAGALISAYIDDLSNWYVRRSRRRFWQGDPAALATLHEALYVLTLVMAPLTPFVTERIWQDLFRSTSAQVPESVHLAAWPRIDGSLIDDRLGAQMSLVRRLVELGRSARASSRIRNRQPLQRALVSAPEWAELPEELRRQVAEELNVTDVEALGATAGELVDVSVKANFRALGRRFAKRTPLVAGAIAAADPRRIAAALAEDGTVILDVEGEAVAVTPEDVIVTETPREGWTVASGGGESVALDLAITPELRRAGIAREVVRLVQDARRTSGFDVSDRISLWWEASGEVADAVTEHASVIADEVLARTLQRSSPDADAPARFRDEDLGLAFWVAKAERGDRSAEDGASVPGPAKRG